MGRDLRKIRKEIGVLMRLLPNKYSATSESRTKRRRKEKIQRKKWRRVLVSHPRQSEGHQDRERVPKTGVFGRISTPRQAKAVLNYSFRA